MKHENYELNSNLSFCCKFLLFKPLCLGALVANELVKLGNRYEIFSPETVEHIQSIIIDDKKPNRVVETPVNDYVQICPHGIKNK